MSSPVRYMDTLVGSDVPHVPADTYLASLDGVELATTRFGEALKWHWLIASEDNFELVQMTSTATTPGSNAGKIIRALTGRTLGPGEKLTMSLVKDKTATLEVEVDPDSGWNRVREVYPAPAKQGSAQAMTDRLAQQAADVVLDDIAF